MKHFDTQLGFHIDIQFDQRRLVVERQGMHNKAGIPPQAPDYMWTEIGRPDMTVDTDLEDMWSDSAGTVFVEVTWGTPRWRAVMLQQHQSLKDRQTALAVSSVPLTDLPFYDIRKKVAATSAITVVLG